MEGGGEADRGSQETSDGGETNEMSSCGQYLMKNGNAILDL